MVSGQLAQKLAAGERRLVLDQRLQKHPMEDRNVKEKLPRQMPVIPMLVQLTVYGEIMVSGLTVRKLAAGERRLVLDQR